MRSLSVVALGFALLCFGTTASALAADFEAAVVDEALPKDKLSQEVAETLQDKAIAVKSGGRSICEIWLRKELQIKPGFQPTFQILYPFTEGQLIGVIRYPSGGHDYRDQEIASGVFTLRYSLQPVDGNHVGTSPTRDFLLLLPAGEDTSAEPIDQQETAVKYSTDVSETSHPALLALKPTQQPEGELPAMRHDQANDWWILQFVGTGKADDKSEDVRVDLVVVGAAME